MSSQADRVKRGMVYCLLILIIRQLPALLCAYTLHYRMEILINNNATCTKISRTPKKKLLWALAKGVSKIDKILKRLKFLSREMFNTTKSAQIAPSVFVKWGGYPLRKVRLIDN